MFRLCSKVVVSIVAASALIGIGCTWTAGASPNPGTNPTPAIPEYGVTHCSGVHTTTGIETNECINLESATRLWISTTVTAGRRFTGHMHVTGTGQTFNTATIPYLVGVTYSYSFARHFGTHIFCVTTWKGASNPYQNMGSACT